MFGVCESFEGRIKCGKERRARIAGGGGEGRGKGVKEGMFAAINDRRQQTGERKTGARERRGERGRGRGREGVKE